MIVCPYCSHTNIEGADACDKCGQSLGDLSLRQPPSEIERQLVVDPVDVLKPRPPLTVSPETPVGQVLRMLVENQVGCIVVTHDSGRLAGIFSERDALMRLNVEAAQLAAKPVSDFMTTSVQSLESTATIAFAVQRMDLGGYRHLPIVAEDGSVTGVISARDILRYLTEKLATAPAV